MKSIKTFGLAAILMLTAIAAIGVTSASANEETVFCKANVTECANENYIGHAFATAGAATTFKLSGVGSVSCTGSMERSEAEQLTALTFTACNEGCAVTATGLPYTTNLHEPVAGNGKLTLNSTFLTFKCGSNECSYNLGKAVELTVTGGEQATIQVNQSLSRLGGGILCPTSVQWEGEYKTKAAPAYVTTRGVSGPMFCTLNSTPCPAASRVTEEEFFLAPKSEVVFSGFVSGGQIKCAASKFKMKNLNPFKPGGEWRYESPTLESCTSTVFTGCTMAWEKTPYTASMEATKGTGSGAISLTETLSPVGFVINCSLAGTKFSCNYQAVSKSVVYKFTGGEPPSVAALGSFNRTIGPGSVCLSPVSMTGTYRSARGLLYLVSS